MPGHMDMQGAGENPLAALSPQQREMMMQPDEEIAAVLLIRLANMSPEELKMLDTAITPEVAGVLMKLLPELNQIIDQVKSEERPQQRPQMGALGGM